MQPLCYIAFVLLCRVHFISSEIFTRCSETQYVWPVDTGGLCCDKCPPGHHMVRREEDTCIIECNPCVGNRFLDSYSVEMSCNICKDCRKPNMEIKSNCTSTHDIVCRCKAGYRCKDQPCTQCVPKPTNTKPTLPPHTTASEALKTTAPYKPVTADTVWILVIAALLCTAIGLIVVTTVKSIRSKHGYVLTEKPAFEDEGVSKPVQEVCGKCDQPIDV